LLSLTREKLITPFPLSSLDSLFVQLPTYATWSANSACTYNFLADNFKQELCVGPSAVTGTNAYSNTWQAFSDNKCTVKATGTGASGSGATVDATFCALSNNAAFPYASNSIVGPYSGGYCNAVKGAPTKYLVLEQYYKDASCANGPSAVNAIIMNQCVASEVAGQFKLATFSAAGDPYGSGIIKDSFANLVITTYTDAACTTQPTPAVSQTFSVVTGPAGLPSTTCTQVRETRMSAMRGGRCDITLPAPSSFAFSDWMCA